MIFIEKSLKLVSEIARCGYSQPSGGHVQMQFTSWSFVFGEMSVKQANVSGPGVELYASS